jgi:pseudaminic acid biosynthesis-associated methylase
MLQPIEGRPPAKILEIGCNIGQNLRALARLTTAELHAVEPNSQARRRLLDDKVLPAERLTDAVAGETGLPSGAYDLVFTSGVLIHIHPDNLEAAVREMHRLSSRYLLCREYFADRPQEIPYRGLTEALFKRDFGGFFLDLFPDLVVRGYGFQWKRTTGLDNPTWWLFEKP